MPIITAGWRTIIPWHASMLPHPPAPQSRYLKGTVYQKINTPTPTPLFTFYSPQGFTGHGKHRSGTALQLGTISVKRLMKTQNRNSQQPDSQPRHGNHLRPQNLHPHAFQIRAAQHNQEVAERDQVTQILHPLRHRADGKPKSRETDSRHDKEERSHHSLLLRG